MGGLGASAKADQLASHRRGGANAALQPQPAAQLAPCCHDEQLPVRAAGRRARDGGEVAGTQPVRCSEPPTPLLRRCDGLGAAQRAQATPQQQGGRACSAAAHSRPLRRERSDVVLPPPSTLSPPPPLLQHLRRDRTGAGVHRVQGTQATQRGVCGGQVVRQGPARAGDARGAGTRGVGSAGLLLHCCADLTHHSPSPPPGPGQVRVLHSMDHPNILRFHAWYETGNHLWLILEYCVGGDLARLLRTDGRLPEASGEGCSGKVGQAWVQAGVERAC